MTPKKKAIELVDKMGFSTMHTIDNTSGQSTPIYKNQYAKQCALIAVEEIINSNPIVKIIFEKNNCSWIESKSNINYWQEVKTEIEKL